VSRIPLGNKVARIDAITFHTTYDCEHTEIIMKKCGCIPENATIKHD